MSVVASIVIPSRAGAQRLPRLLAALERQDRDDWEAIIVLDGDIDDSESVVREFADTRVRSIIFEHNRGRVAALNAGFADARGEILIRCDDDLEPETNYVSNHVAAHEGRDVGVVGLPRNVLPVTPYTKVYGSGADLRFRDEAYRVPPELRWRYWAGNVSVSRATYERVGEYDPRYRAYGWEDVDFGYRLFEAGIPIELVPELETTHHMAAVTTRIRADRAFHSGAARRTFESIHGMVLPSPDRPLPGAWNRAVRAVGVTFGRRSLLVTARVVDAAARVLPRAVARKAVALLVEGGALSGYRRAHQVTTEL